jgi:hypothetical protein
VAVAPEPVKQDLINDEILESVPKTTKAKAQLLLKKMKGVPLEVFGALESGGIYLLRLVPSLK